MERIIAGLLENFECGRMSRRQLIRSLALVVGGGYGLGSARAAAAGAAASPADAPFTTKALDHISFQCSDYGRSRDFYAGLMGWKVIDDDRERQALMAIGDVGGIIIRNASSPIPGPVSVNIDHISWAIGGWDTQRVREELETRGLEPRRDTGGDSLPGYDSYHVHDPDGWDLQISNGRAEDYSNGRRSR